MGKYIFKYFYRDRDSMVSSNNDVKIGQNWSNNDFKIMTDLHHFTHARPCKGILIFHRARVLLFLNLTTFGSRPIR